MLSPAQKSGVPSSVPLAEGCELARRFNVHGPANDAECFDVQGIDPSTLGSRAAQAAVMQCEASATSALEAMIEAYEGGSGSPSARNSAELHALQARRLGSQRANEITAIWCR